MTPHRSRSRARPDWSSCRSGGRQILGQKSARRIDRGLHVAGGAVDVAIKIELQSDACVPEAAGRGHLREAREWRRTAAQAAWRPTHAMVSGLAPGNVAVT